MTVLQLGIYSVTNNHKNNPQLCKFFVLPGNGPTLLCMPVIETLDILMINCNTVNMQTSRSKAAEKQMGGTI